jgi:hypothetical protein
LGGIQRFLRLYSLTSFPAFLVADSDKFEMSSTLIPAASSDNPWKTYMGEIYTSRKPPQPLGTVKFEEIEAQAKDKLKDIPGALRGHHLKGVKYPTDNLCRRL